MAEQLLAGRYRLEQEIGAGGMGRVWRSRDVRLDREVAIKTVDVSGLGEPSVARRFEREIVLTARLNSPHTVTVYDGGVDGRTAYLVMELLSGESLADRIRRTGPLSLAETLDVARQVTLGLATAHAIGLVHRDIKPANVMLSEGRVKLLDFGIAQLIDQVDAQLTAPSMTIGTAAYMSPEQAAGRRVDAAADLYALGCLIMTMLTARPPFDGDQAVVVASNQLNAVPPRLQDRQPDAPAALDALVARLLAKDPRQRPTTAETLRVLDQLRVDPDAATAFLAQPPGAPVVPMPGGPLGSAPIQPGPTRPYTQVAPSPPVATSPIRTLQHLQPSGSWWLAGVLVGLMAAVLAGGVAAGVTGAVAAQLFNGSSSRSTSPSPKPSPKPTPKVTPSKSPTPTPSKSPTRTGPSVALGAALQGVRTALGALPDSPAKADLLDKWDATSQRIEEGRAPKATLTLFHKAVERSDLSGWEKQAVIAATSIVGGLL